MADFGALTETAQEILARSIEAGWAGRLRSRRSAGWFEVEDRLAELRALIERVEVAEAAFTARPGEAEGEALEICVQLVAGYALGWAAAFHPSLGA
jgi:hypothetical protein